MHRAILTAVSCMIAASAARAEPLPGDYQADVGGHMMMLFGDSCEQGGDVVSCQGALLFAGFDVGGHIQLGPWFALGLRFAGSFHIDGSSSTSSLPNGELATMDRDLWLWQLALQARFDPPLWPPGLWLGAEAGAAFSVDDVDQFGSAGALEHSTSLHQTSLLLAAAVGYDIALGEGFLIGFTLRGQYLSLQTLPGPREGFGDREVAHFPYVSLGMRLSTRW